MVLKSDDDDNGGDDISSQLGIHDGNMMLINLIMVHINLTYCLAMRGQIMKDMNLGKKES